MEAASVLHWALPVLIGSQRSQQTHRNTSFGLVCSVSACSMKPLLTVLIYTGHDVNMAQYQLAMVFQEI